MYTSDRIETWKAFLGRLAEGFARSFFQGEQAWGAQPAEGLSLPSVVSLYPSTFGSPVNQRFWEVTIRPITLKQSLKDKIVPEDVKEIALFNTLYNVEFSCLWILPAYTPLFYCVNILLSAFQ